MASACVVVWRLLVGEGEETAVGEIMRERGRAVLWDGIGEENILLVGVEGWLVGCRWCIGVCIGVRLGGRRRGGDIRDGIGGGLEGRVAGKSVDRHARRGIQWMDMCVVALTESEGVL